MEGFEINQIHKSAIISSNSRVGKNVTIGSNVIIYDNVEIGDNTIIGPGCIVGEPLNDYYYNPSDYKAPPTVIEENGLIRSGTIIYGGVIIGENFQSGHRVTIRENSFIGKNSRIGTLSDIQGDCKIGNYTSIHSNVFLGKKGIVGDYVWIFPNCVITNDPTPPSNELIGVEIENYAVIAAMVTVLPGIRIGMHSIVGAHSLVRLDVLPRTLVAGIPAKEIAHIADINSRITGEPAYPWPEHFERGMPWEGVGYEKWSKRNDS